MMVLLPVISACSSDDKQENQDKPLTVDSPVGVVPVHLISEADMPQWLAEKLVVAKKDNYSPLLPLLVLKGSSNGEHIYFINNPYANCLFCEVYDEKGLSINDVAIIESAKDWVCIYQYTD